MSFLEVLRRITSALDDAGIAYMLTGSFASVYYGSPRSTQDIDIVISAGAQELQDFLARLPGEDYYAEPAAALEAHRNESLFNVIDIKTGWKIDLIIRKSRAFSRGEFSRRLKVDYQGTSLFIATAEDLIVAKLEWAKLGESERQISDAAAILQLRGSLLDRAYIEKWVDGLGLIEQWKRLSKPASG
ncbi:MAG TPA: hypothetical protein VND65_15370 [Candidatus Binatia bacterium]|nr:hypothetical protein [Candidatus Binatia bacterium]